MLSREEWENTFRGVYQGETEFGFPMKDCTSLAIGGPADVMVSPDDPLSMRNLIVVLSKKGIPYITLGGGTNMLVSDNGIEGVVLSLKTFRRIEVLKEGNKEVELFVEAGVTLQRLVNFCKERGYSGIEGLTGIPGTVGGAICGNAGSFDCEIKDVLDSVAIMDSKGRLDRFKAAGLGFGYRKSDISDDDIVLSANMRLKRDEKDAVALRTDNFFREKKRNQPISERSAGCVFKNPEGMSAGRLIDEAGCKGMRRGGIEVSTLHANFFVNSGGGTAADYIDLMNEVSSAVHKKFAVLLQPEIKVAGKV
ncbi:MAG: UDP-N-acetylmuramate dehydrogenase [Nitrospirota bacterium]